MDNTLTLEGTSYSVTETELHLPMVDEVRLMYMSAEAPPHGWFALWEIELALLDNIDDLDGKRIHVRPNGETYDDDTLGTDIIGAENFTDMNYWHGPSPDEGYSYGDIQVDFERLEGRTYRVRVQCSLTESDEDPEDLSPEDYNVTGTADFTVTVDEQNPME